MKNTLVIVIILLLAGLLGWRLYQKVAEKSAGSQPRQGLRPAVAVLLQPVRHEAIRDVREFTGTIYPKTQFLVAPKVAGRLERLLVNIGQAVTNGDLIALLDSQEYSLQVVQAQAELEVTKANLNDSQSTLDISSRELERVKELRQQKIASEAELDQADARGKAAQANHDVALAQVQQREAALKSAQVRLSYTRIEAAWDSGDPTRVIGERYVDEGAMLPANQPIVSILDVDTVIATIFVIERDYPSIHVGQATILSTDAFPDQRFSGNIARVSPLLRESSRQARVEIEVPNPDHRLVPGMFVRADIEFASHPQATIIPVAAVARRNNVSGVFLADTNALTAHFVPITIGIVSGGAAEVVEPTLDGQVVTLGQHLLEDGSAILVPDADPVPGDREERRGGPP